MITAAPAERPALRWSIGLLVIANLIPVAGVLFWDWDVFYLMFLFWCENVIIGVFGIAKIVTIGKGFLDRIFTPVFFSVHYGGFMAGHIFFIFSLFFEKNTSSESGMFSVLGTVLTKVGWLPIVALFISHGWSFFNNFLTTDERLDLTPQNAMAAPYRRMVITHVAIIASGFLLTKLGEPLVGLLMLVGMKIALDIVFHQREHSSKA